MALTAAQAAELNFPDRIDVATVAVGDRVRHATKSVGTVVAVSANRVNGYGAIQWDGDRAPVESALRCWKSLRRA